MSKCSELVFPHRPDHRYWSTHFKYIINSAKEAGINVRLEDVLKIKRGYCNLGIPALLDERYCIFDFQNTPECEMREEGVPVFKFHYEPMKASDSLIFPFGTSWMLDWNLYRRCLKNIEYKAQGNVLFNQNTYGGKKNYIKRVNVQSVLNKSGISYDCSLTSQETYFIKFNRCLCHVFVGGHHEHSLDRGQLQAMSFGVCTISTELYEELPFGMRLIPDFHYIECEEDYSDLSAKIEWCKHNTEKCIQIGKNAQSLISTTITPEFIWPFVNTCLKNIT